MSKATSSMIIASRNVRSRPARIDRAAFEVDLLHLGSHPKKDLTVRKQMFFASRETNSPIDQSSFHPATPTFEHSKRWIVRQTLSFSQTAFPQSDGHSFPVLDNCMLLGGSMQG
jgi:hypothetical protein